ncbi:hypothetical protein KL935_004389 [Ogataea polymorpha]|nr:hypothetical protein KL935_004389 [Ogataea polymorpha]KAG7901064.1 hypothetical protein KL907_004509 [Ogataea polymorpha]KAG7906432.1 hypothetical protein KL906_004524 [Ogataea polymorpha]KAG7914461.1 hypothetical protein KL927_004655 [Ogataea polymorpha]
MSSPFSGRAGLRSPRKKRLEDEDLRLAKLRSPAKRSMAELNRAAVERATRLKLESLQDDEDEIDAEEMALADRIIAESKKDGLTPLELEESEHESGEESVSEFEDDPMEEIDDGVSDDEFSGKRIWRPRRAAQKASRASRTPEASVVPLKETDLKPLQMSTVKLMEIPKIDRTEDLLLNFADEEKSLFYDGHEGYFEQQKLKNKKPGTASMALAPELNYEEYEKYSRILEMSAEHQIEKLSNYYRLQFPQWTFELQQGFNLVFYGVGSKRVLVLEFLQQHFLPAVPGAKCLVVNGYNPDFRPKTLLSMIQETVLGVCPAGEQH